MRFRQKLTDSPEDQLSLAVIHYVSGRYQEATDTYKRMLSENREYLALQVYIALCYYKLDYNEISLEILLPYVEKVRIGVMIVWFGLVDVVAFHLECSCLC